MSRGCPYIAAPTCRDCDGRCWDAYDGVQESRDQYEGMTEDQICESMGHPPYGLDPNGPGGQPVERCHCGSAIYEVPAASPGEGE